MVTAVSLSSQSGANHPGRGGAMGMPYMAPHHAGAFMQQLGGRWMGGMHPGMGQYQRRDLASKKSFTKKTEEYRTYM